MEVRGKLDSNDKSKLRKEAWSMIFIIIIIIGNLKSNKRT